MEILSFKCLLLSHTHRYKIVIHVNLIADLLKV